MSKKNVGIEGAITFAKLRASIINKPLSERPELPIGRGGEKVIPRRHSLTPVKVKALRETYEASGKTDLDIPNPQNVGNYFYIIEALKSLGANKTHDFHSVRDEMKRQMSLAGTKVNDETAWERFAGKDARNSETGKDVNGRIRQNIEVLQRVGGKSLNQYGYKLFQVGKEILGTSGMVIDIMKITDDEKEKVGYRLNTDSALPLNEWKRVKAEKTVTAKPTKKTSPKSSKKPAKKTTKRVKKETPVQTDVPETQPAEELVTA